MQSNSTPSPVPSKPASKTTKVSSGCQKPEKPYPDFPLFPHATKRWAKKIRGQMHYFGPWNDPDGALAKYLDEKNDLHAGRTPRAETGELTVKQLVNAFLNEKQAAVDSRELSRFTFHDYKTATDMMIVEFGKNRLVGDLDPSAFAKMRRAMTKKWGLHRISKIIQCVRTVFKFGVDNGMIEKVVLFGTGFKKPDKKTFRIARAKEGEKFFTPQEIKSMLEAATVSMRAMILLGINAGFGNGDCATLPLRAINLETGWMSFPRPKTGLSRRCPLWPETVDALKTWLAVRPAPKDKAHADLVFITASGGSWSKETSDNPVSKEMAKLLKKLNINSHRNFYTLRHTFRTVADAVCDQRGAAFIMGHSNNDIGSHYVEHIADERLRKITDYVRDWLLPFSDHVRCWLSMNATDKQTSVE